MNKYINDYVIKYSDLDFNEKPFNNVDACVFAILCYCNFECVAPVLANNGLPPFYFRDLHDVDLSLLAHNVTFGKDNNLLLNVIRKSKRYSNVGVKFVNKVHNAVLSNQFFAVTFEIPCVGHYIGFRGTDSTVVGWKEDLLCSVRKVIPSQLDALDYVNIVAGLVDGPLFVGGHSKGGNLSLYASINCDKAVKKRIVNSFTFDGNGLATKDFYESDLYKEIQEKIVFICPEDSIIGEIFYNPKVCLTVKSKGKGMQQHYPHNWKIDLLVGDFLYTDHRTLEARARHRTLKIWNNETSNEHKVLMINFLGIVCGGESSSINYLLDKRFKSFYILKALKSLPKDEQSVMVNAYKHFKKIGKESLMYYKNKESNSCDKK